jgi:hypothetical protein
MPENTQTTAGETAEYDRFAELDDVEYDRVNAFLRDYVTFTAREWAIARLCADFRTETGVEMTRIGENLPDLVPFMPQPYTRQAVYDARRSFVDKVRNAGATFLYGVSSGLLAAEEVEDVTFEATEVAKFLLEVEGATLSHDAEAAAERQVREAMAEVHDASLELRYDECPHCGETLDEEAASS